VPDGEQAMSAGQHDSAHPRRTLAERNGVGRRLAHGGGEGVPGFQALETDRLDPVRDLVDDVIDH
jgi:hypothetical protein